MSQRNFDVMQNNIIKLCAIAVAGLITSNAMATYITYETRHTNAGVNTSDYRASWNLQTSAISTVDLGQFTNRTAPGSHFHSHLQVEFDVNAAQDWLFEIAPDAGYGGALYMNDALVQHRATDLWWGFNWNAANEMLVSTGAAFTLGTNVLDVYWAEACCNGGQSGRFSINGGQDWMTLSMDSLNSTAVPEPGMLLLLSGGILGLALARRRQRG